MPTAVRIAACDPSHPDARYCLRAYFAELARRFDGGFDPGLSISADDRELSPPAGLFVVATRHGEPAGCGALKFHRDAPAEIKRMWVAPAARGLGLGRRILAELEARAAVHGVRTLRLETNRALAEAIALYRTAGYREVAPFNDEPYAHHWFEKTLAPLWNRGGHGRRAVMIQARPSKNTPRPVSCAARVARSRRRAASAVAASSRASRSLGLRRPSVKFGRHLDPIGT